MVAQGYGATFCLGVSITCQSQTNLGVTPASCWDSAGCGLTLQESYQSVLMGTLATLVSLQHPPLSLPSQPEFSPPLLLSQLPVILGGRSLPSALVQMDTVLGYPVAGPERGGTQGSASTQPGGPPPMAHGPPPQHEPCPPWGDTGRVPNTPVLPSKYSSIPTVLAAGACVLCVVLMQRLLKSCRKTALCPQSH